MVPFVGGPQEGRGNAETSGEPGGLGVAADDERAPVRMVVTSTFAYYVGVVEALADGAGEAMH